MNPSSGKPAVSLDPHLVDLFEFARSARQSAGAVRLSQLPRMLNEVPADAPDRDATFTWQAEGSTQSELQDDGSEGQQPYLRLALHGAAWLECQRCMTPYQQAFDIDMVYRIVATEEEAEAIPLDENDEVDVIVGSRQFDLVDLIEEELLLSLPLVPKHEVCPSVHESLTSGVSGPAADAEAFDEAEEPAGDEAGGEASGEARPNPFAALEALKRDGDKKH
ncbi:DUF177 domain-containing protein [Burkholderia gladioli]|uniref:DUF177 domain-containing protein n=1 Tax=Burkholderia TaxID=32008 RepID=UPI0014228ADD|nr:MULTISPECIES: DUF177 domain-containing protein [Burkholderia]MDA0574668.1 DUF177 domain-containing protein [Burkholderia gladioli]MDA0602981.1 DUF177 domain-containing protein [Burkholderia gladioli]NIF69682.1 DUF177 domain-containing protein [Burkholderia sp. Ap-962]NIF88397.1 DUF177 domain-containing protein [Burkholderia sp. Cy-637]